MFGYNQKLLSVGIDDTLEAAEKTSSLPFHEDYYEEGEPTQRARRSLGELPVSVSYLAETDLDERAHEHRTNCKILAEAIAKGSVIIDEDEADDDLIDEQMRKVEADVHREFDLASWIKIRHEP